MTFKYNLNKNAKEMQYNNQKAKRLLIYFHTENTSYITQYKENANAIEVF